VDWAQPVAAVSAPPASLEPDASAARSEPVLAPAAAFELARALQEAQDAAVAKAQISVASELYLAAERRARIRRGRFVEQALDPLPVPDGSNALSV
jgi:hypothetical protein